MTRVGRHLRRLGPARRRRRCRRACRRDDDHALAVGAEHVVEEVDVGVGGRAEDDALRARAQRVAHRGQRRAGRRRPGPARASSRVIRSRWSRFCGVPVRAPSRSTTCRKRAPCLDPGARGLERRVARRRSLVEVALDEADGLPVADVDRGVEDHAAARGADARRSSQQRQAVRRTTSRGGTARRRRCRAPTTRGEGRAVVADAERRPSSSRGPGSEGVHVVEGGAVAAGRRAAARGASSGTSFQPMCGSFRPAARGEPARPRPAAGRGPRRRRARRSARRAAACPRHSPRTGDAGRARSRTSTSSSPASRRRAMAAGNAPTPGTTRPSARARARRGRR